MDFSSFAGFAQAVLFRFMHKAEVRSRQFQEVCCAAVAWVSVSFSTSCAVQVHGVYQSLSLQRFRLFPSLPRERLPCRTHAVNPAWDSP